MAVENFFEIKKDFFILKSPEKDFHRNIFFRIFRGKKKNINLIMDPGTKQDLENITTISKELIGGINNIDLIFLSHQDPDLTSILPYLIPIAKKAKILTSEDSWRLIKMYGNIPENRFIPVENFKKETLILKHTGHKIGFIPAVFCHFRGSVMFYDYENRILFSGDFLGGVNTKKEDGIYAKPKSWDGIKLFHEIYMPTTFTLRETINRISLLDPFPEIIAPHHGDIIKGDLIMDFLNRLYDLDVGSDLMKKMEVQKELTIIAVNEFLTNIKREAPEAALKLLSFLKKTGNFTNPFTIKKDVITNIKVSPNIALKVLWGKIPENESSHGGRNYKKMFLTSLKHYNIRHKFEDDENDKSIEDLFI